MHLSISCPTHPEGGWGNTGDLTNRGVKFLTTGAKSVVKSPLFPHPLVGDLTTPQGRLADISCMRLVITWSPVASKFIASAILLFRNATTENRSVIWGQLSIAPGVGTRSNVKSPLGVWGRPGVGQVHYMAINVYNAKP